MTPTPSRLRRLARLLPGIVLMAACSEHNVSTNSSKPGTTKALLIDAPFPYDQVARVDVYIVSVAASSKPDTLDPANAALGFGYVGYMQVRNSAMTGSVSGTVKAANAGPIADASIALLIVNPNYPNDEATWGVLGTARSDTTGRFRLPYASPGSYVLAVDAPATSAYGGQRLPNVGVSIGAETQTGTLVVPHK